MEGLMFKIYVCPGLYNKALQYQMRNDRTVNDFQNIKTKCSSNKPCIRKDKSAFGGEDLTSP
jgi:hypothetical protein